MLLTRAFKGFFCDTATHTLVGSRELPDSLKVIFNFDLFSYCKTTPTRPIYSFGRTQRNLNIKHCLNMLAVLIQHRAAISLSSSRMPSCVR
jgi:hypothetical protein